MDPVICPRCKIRVLLSPEGICPGCRKPVEMPVYVAQAVPEPGNECPMCHAALPPRAVLCIACGYLPEKGGFLGTTVERNPFEPLPEQDSTNPFRDADQSASHGALRNLVDLNPYASPALLNQSQTVVFDSPFVADLTPYAVKRAAAIVADAGRVYLLIILSLCVCRIGWLVMGPWYAYRLYSWYEMNRTYSELRNPRPRVSAYYSLALDFQAAKTRLWVGFVVGGMAFLLVLAAGIFAIVSHELEAK